LWVADPKAISHILKNTVTRYGKPSATRELIALVIDRGLSWADGRAFSNLASSSILTSAGDVHKRQRRAMTPAFGLVEAKGLLPYFAQSATKVRDRPMSIWRRDR
jgi:cytochrome P450